MSSENVEVARTLIEAFNAGDWDRYFDLLDPDIAWWDREDDPGATVHRGHQGIRDYLAEVAEATEFRAHAEELVAEGDSVIVCLRFNGRGVASGAEFEQREVHVLRLRHGKVFETREYQTKDQALEALGRASTTDVSI